MLSARTALLLIGLLTLLPCSDAAPYSPVECCFDYVKRIVRLENLVGFYSTSRECFLQAIVFDTKKKAKICANPEENWVKRAVRVIRKKKGLHAP